MKWLIPVFFSKKALERDEALAMYTYVKYVDVCVCVPFVQEEEKQKAVRERRRNRGSRREE